MQSALEALLKGTDIEINGDRPWDIKVHNPNFYRRVLGGGSLALGESYMDHWWDCEALDQMIYRLFKADINIKVIPWHDKVKALVAMCINWQTRARAFNIGEKHYDVGNDLFEKMLDTRMVYSCAYWKDAETIDEAQEAKLELICQKLGLEADMQVLDIGCGWGSFANMPPRNTRSKSSASRSRRNKQPLPRNVAKVSLSASSSRTTVISRGRLIALCP